MDEESRKTADQVMEKEVMADLLEGFHSFAEPVLEIMPSLGLYDRAVAASPDPPLKSCQVSVSECASEAQAGVVL